MKYDLPPLAPLTAFEAAAPLLYDQMMDVTWADWYRKMGVQWGASAKNISFSHTSHAIGRLVRPFNGDE